MTALRRALAVPSVSALVAAVAAVPAGAATIKTDPCVRYVAGQETMTVIGAGFTPNGLVSLSTVTKAAPTPAVFSSSSVLATGAFLKATAPPPFSKPTRNLESFLLVASDSANPAAPLLATTPFQLVRFGATTSPSPKRPTSRVTYTARGFATGKRVYIHFRFGGKTRRTVDLGVAKGPCGITSKRMRALPTKARYGVWTTYTDQTKKFSAKTLPAWKDSFTIFRRFG
jgi:hypothetical protein